MQASATGRRIEAPTGVIGPDQCVVSFTQRPGGTSISGFTGSSVMGRAWSRKSSPPETAHSMSWGAPRACATSRARAAIRCARAGSIAPPPESGRTFPSASTQRSPSRSPEASPSASPDTAKRAPEPRRPRPRPESRHPGSSRTGPRTRRRRDPRPPPRSARTRDRFPGVPVSRAHPRHRTEPRWGSRIRPARHGRPREVPRGSPPCARRSPDRSPRPAEVVDGELRESGLPEAREVLRRHLPVSVVPLPEPSHRADDELHARFLGQADDSGLGTQEGLQRDRSGSRRRCFSVQPGQESGRRSSRAPARCRRRSARVKSPRIPAPPATAGRRHP